MVFASFCDSVSQIWPQRMPSGYFVLGVLWTVLNWFMLFVFHEWVFLDFIADAMLGKLARWLRMLGHNVTYYRHFDDKTLIDLAKSGNRVLLTRDVKLYQRTLSKGLQGFLVDKKDDSQKLAVLAKHFGFKLQIDMNLSRCPKCNGDLDCVSKNTLKDQIPTETFTYYDDFWKCKSCSQVYWQGAHWKRIQGVLDEAMGQLSLL